MTQHLGYFYWEWWSPTHSNPYIARDNPTADGGTVTHTNILGDYWIHDACRSVCHREPSLVAV